MARVQARQERVKALPEQIGIAMGIDVHLATVRGKAFLPLPDDLARDLFSSTTVASRDRPTTTSDDIVEPVTTLARWDLRLSPRAALEVAAENRGELRQALGQHVAEADALRAAELPVRGAQRRERRVFSHGLWQFLQRVCWGRGDERRGAAEERSSSRLRRVCDRRRFFLH